MCVDSCAPDRLQLNAVVHRRTGQLGDLVAAQAGHPAARPGGQPDLRGGIRARRNSQKGPSSNRFTHSVSLSARAATRGRYPLAEESLKATAARTGRNRGSQAAQRPCPPTRLDAPSWSARRQDSAATWSSTSRETWDRHAHPVRLMPRGRAAVQGPSRLRSCGRLQGVECDHPKSTSAHPRVRRSLCEPSFR